MADNRAPTIYDVARAAGVAPSTVSRAFARPGRVSAATAERIRAVAAELGFRPNPMARAMPTGRSSLIALIVADLADPYCAEVARGAQAAAGRSGYAMLLPSAGLVSGAGLLSGGELLTGAGLLSGGELLSGPGPLSGADGTRQAALPTGPDAGTNRASPGEPASVEWAGGPSSGGGERAALHRALAIADGVVVATPGLSDAAVLEIAGERPVVVLDRVVAGVPSVLTDNSRGMRQTVAHLAALGHEHITYLAGPAESWADAARRRSLRQAGTEQGVQSRRIGPFPPTSAGGAAAADEVLRRPTTAVVAFNDLMAVGLIRELTIRGVRVPEDISVAGFDGIAVAELTTPAVTTVAAPLRLLGSTAVRHLLAVIEGAEPSVGSPLILPASLLVRASTGRRRP